MTRLALLMLAALLALLVWVTNAPAQQPSLAPQLDAIATALSGIHVPAVTGYDAGSPTPIATPPRTPSPPPPTPSPPPTRTPPPHHTPRPEPTPRPIFVPVPVQVPNTAPPQGVGPTAITIPLPPNTDYPPPHNPIPYGCGSTCGGGGMAFAPVTGP